MFARFMTMREKRIFAKVTGRNPKRKLEAITHSSKIIELQFEKNIAIHYYVFKEF